MRSVRNRLEDVLEAINRIEDERTAGREHFERDPRAQVWMIYHLQIIGEAVRVVMERLKVLDPGTPWPQVVGMRNILVHDYFGIDTNEVWLAVETDVPKLKTAVEALLGRDDLEFPAQ